MSDRRNRQASRLLGVVALGIAAYYSVLGGEYDLADVRILRDLAAYEAARLDSLEAELDSVAAWADSLETDPEVIERVARERHSFIRPGERLYVFLDDSGPEAPGAADPNRNPR